MTFLPVVQRELLVASRSTAIRGQRFGAVGAGILVFALILVSGRHTPQIVGERLFNVLAGLLWILAWLAGPLFTSDALTREKREGTLGLLLLTDLRGYDVILGKLAATALHQVMMLIGVLPVLALPVALGGIAPGEFWRVSCSLLLTQALSLTLGLACSTVCRTFWQALRALLGLLGLVTVLPVAVMVGYAVASRTPPKFWLSLGPLLQTLCGFAEFQRVNPGAGNRWSQGAGLLLGLAVIALAVAAVAIRRQSLEGETYAPVPESEPDASPLAGWRHIVRRDWLDENPYYWLERACRPERRPLALWAWLAMGISGLIMLAAVALRIGQSTAVDPGLVFIAFGAAFVAAQLIKLGVLIAGTRRLGEDLRSGGLELLLTTPLTPAEIVGGCRRALFAEFQPLLISLLLLLLALVAGVSWIGDFGWAPIVAYSFLAAAAGAMLLLDCRWGIEIALRASLRESDPLRALRGAVVRVLAPGWVAGGGLGAVAFTSGAFGGFFYYCFAYGIAVALVHASARRARIDLEFGLRDIAAGTGFNTDQMELAEDFRKAAMTWEDRWFTPR